MRAFGSPTSERVTDAVAEFMLLASTRVSAPTVHRPKSTLLMVTWRNVAAGLKMKGVIFGRESARVDAEALISVDVGSSHETTPKDIRGEQVQIMSQHNPQTEAAVVYSEDALDHKFFPSWKPLDITVGQ